MARVKKNSNIEWIGEIPFDWSIVRIKYLHNNEIDAFQDGDWIESPYITDEGIRYLTTGNVGDGVFKNQGDGYISEETFKKLNCKYAYPGDLVISRLNAPYGRSCILPEGEDKYVLAVDIVILRTDHDKRFLNYLMQCTGYQNVVQDGAKGTTMKRISRTNLGNVSLPIAPIEEQKLIADFLDSECSRIDSVIEQTRASIEEYKKLKQAVITQAVTKGIRPGKVMKDSGIEWIGEIPESWGIHQIKYDFQIISGATPKSERIENWDGDIVWITPADFKTDDRIVSRGKRNISDAGYSSCGTTLVPIGSIIFSKRAPIGTVAITNTELCTNQGCLSCVPHDDSCSNYYYYVMAAFTEQFNLLGTGTTFKEISYDNFGAFRVPHPSYQEQHEIAAYLNEKTEEIASLISKKETLLSELEFYKKSLIYEYVTGKKEV